MGNLDPKRNKIQINLRERTFINSNAYASNSGYSGDATDEMIWYHDGMMFTTFDRDNDLYPGVNCAVWDIAAWWHRTCAVANINGVNGPTVRDTYCWWDLPYGCGMQASRVWVRCG